MALVSTNHKEAGGFKPLPVGKYEVFIESGQAKKTAAGSPMINWKLTVRDDVEGQEGGGRKLFTNLVIQENTMGMVQGFLKAVGAPDGMDFETAEEIINFAKGKAVRVSVKITQYQGEDRNEIGYFMESEAGGGKVEDPFANTAQTGGSKVDEDPFANTSGGPIEVDEDDLPF